MNYSKIKKLSENKSFAIKDLAKKIKISEAGLHQMIRKESMKIDILEKISEALNVPVSYFFNESDGKGNITINNVANGKQNNVSILNNENENLRKENKLLKDKIKDKEEIIKLLKQNK